MIAEEPELPQLLSDAEIDAKIPADEVVHHQKYQKQPTDAELAKEAVALLKAQYPRLHQTLVALWGTGPGEDYLDRLIVDDRGHRQGFPPDVLRGLLSLQRIHVEKFGTFKKVDPWDIG